MEFLISLEQYNELIKLERNVEYLWKMNNIFSEKAWEDYTDWQLKDKMKIKKSLLYGDFFVQKYKIFTTIM